VDIATGAKDILWRSCRANGDANPHTNAVVVDGEIVAREMWTLSLVFDHRLVDGAPAARFLQHIKTVIEEPYLLLA